MQEAAARGLRRGLERLRPLAKNKTLRYGVPMMLLIIGGSFGLREFAQIRYDAQKLHSKCVAVTGSPVYNLDCVTAEPFKPTSLGCLSHCDADVKLQTSACWKDLCCDVSYSLRSL
ncbi:cytochrome c oxidase assembly protein COX16 homolog, mitochondrial isoform X2 [Chelonoidis abingdonii]|uniref:cytochrome c oxidase assembly protein COX16 homolog, mitochondrial isoform X2 n=1 Tax=Chelonoidis abingdonii TaxID=106734 RepID=UPI0013F23C54|nr:uncharacterized protein LOC116824878 isoform X2 [Chelonoidis abingdonii]